MMPAPLHDLRRAVAAGPRRARLAVIAAMLLAASGSNAAASDDHDGPAPRSIVVAPRAEARIGAQEVVVTHVGGKVVVFMQRYVDGVPTSGADVEVTIDLIPETLEEVAPGIYSSGPWPVAAGRNDVELAYTLGGDAGTAALQLIVPSNTARGAPLRAASATATRRAVPGVVLAVFAVLIYAGVTGLLMRRARRA